MGWLVIRFAQDGLPAGLGGELAAHKGLYAYLYLGTSIVLASFGAVLGAVADRLVKANQLLEELAITDGLTALKNRRYFRDRLATECARAQREGSGPGLIAVDLDHFKRLNDRLGHAAGDQALLHAARLLTQNARSMDEVCRVGGEEFELLCPEAGLEELSAIAERIRAAFAQHPVALPSGPEPLTASFGVAAYASGLTPDQLVRAADEALYEAKRGGRNRVVCAGPSPRSAIA